MSSPMLTKLNKLNAKYTPKKKENEILNAILMFLGMGLFTAMGVYILVHWLFF